jgi:hypothetical protein
MGIAGVKPRQLTPTVGTTGSGSTKLAGSVIINVIAGQIASTQLVFYGTINSITNKLHRPDCIYKLVRSGVSSSRFSSRLSQVDSTTKATS